MNTETLLREALAELVELKKMKERADAISPVAPGYEKEILLDEYRRRQPIAWERARAALAETKRPLDEQMARLNKKVIELTAENDELRGITPALLDEADARRYRWLRNHIDWGGWYWDGSNNMLHGEELDAAIDAAMSQEPR